MLGRLLVAGPRLQFTSRVALSKTSILMDATMTITPIVVTTRLSDQSGIGNVILVSE